MAAYPSALPNEDILSGLGHRRPWVSTTFVGKHLPILTASHTLRIAPLLSCRQRTLTNLFLLWGHKGFVWFIGV